MPFPTSLRLGLCVPLSLHTSHRLRYFRCLSPPRLHIENRVSISRLQHLHLARTHRPTHCPSRVTSEKEVAATKAGGSKRFTDIDELDRQMAAVEKAAGIKARYEELQGHVKVNTPQASLQ